MIITCVRRGKHLKLMVFGHRKWGTKLHALSLLGGRQEEITQQAWQQFQIECFILVRISSTHSFVESHIHRNNTEAVQIPL